MPGRLWKTVKEKHVLWSKSKLIPTSSDHQLLEHLSQSGSICLELPILHNSYPHRPVHPMPRLHVVSEDAEGHRSALRIQLLPEDAAKLPGRSIRDPKTEVTGTYLYHIRPYFGGIIWGFPKMGVPMGTPKYCRCFVREHPDENG